MKTLPLVELSRPNTPDEDMSLPIEEAVEYVSQRLHNLATERVASIQCKNGRALNYCIHSIGGFHSVSMHDYYIITRVAVLSNADEIIIVHNHPISSKAEPSLPDKIIVYRLNLLFSMLGIKLRDFIVVSTPFSYSESQQWKYSLRESEPEYFNVPDLDVELPFLIECNKQLNMAEYYDVFGTATT